MFGSYEATGLMAGEIRNDDWLFADDFDDRIYLLMIEALDEDWEPSDPDQLPYGFDLIPPGPLLSAALSRVDRSCLNGYDLVRTLQARERLVAHHQAGSMADQVEISHAAPGHATSPPKRLEEAFEYASDEIRAALTLTRKGADSRLSMASTIVESLPRLWEMLNEGLLDWSRAAVITRGVSHLEPDEACDVLDTVAERAPRLTTGQLAAWIRRLCVDSDPERARKREKRAIEDRTLWIEATPDGAGDVHLLRIPIEKAKAIGRRVNAHLFSLKRDGDSRTHDQLRADITIDLLLGADPTNGGRGLVDIRVDLTTLAGLDDGAAEIPGMGPVIADVARRVADNQNKAEWRVVVTDEDGNLVDIVTTRRRPTKALSRYMDATHPTCSFPGCRMPARDCDFDHMLPWHLGGETSRRNGDLKCRHDHILKDHGWTHQRLGDREVWTSPLGHTYVTEKPP